MKNYWKLFLSVITFGGILLGVVRELCSAIKAGVKNIIRDDEREKRRAKQEEEYRKQREARKRELEEKDQERRQERIEEQEKFLENEVEFREINGIMHFKNQKGHWVPCSINTVKSKKK